MESATAILKTQIGKDGFGDKKFTMRFLPAANIHSAFYYVLFDPPIPDSTAKDPNIYVGYIVEMSGYIKQTKVTISYSSTPGKMPPYSPEGPPIFRPQTSENLFKDPITLRLRNN